MQTTDNRPWLRYYGAVPTTIDYPRITLYAAVAASAKQSQAAIAWDFLGTTATYGELLASIDACADALAALAVRRNKQGREAKPEDFVWLDHGHSAPELDPSVDAPCSGIPMELNYGRNAVGKPWKSSQPEIQLLVQLCRQVGVS